MTTDEIINIEKIDNLNVVVKGEALVRTFELIPPTGFQNLGNGVHLELSDNIFFFRLATTSINGVYYNSVANFMAALNS
jgi:hypothetical protein